MGGVVKAESPKTIDQLPITNYRSLTKTITYDQLPIPVVLLT